ncbi:hypothetical protein ACJ72_00733 [Emergomyces africanus]|uniref:Urease accessory protein UreD n=1 Tax=Emergomyces africanus TaxID=1955775 RepID=A0A1B7P772_9EURO|nr:hypothetical protein ACJ72_00733 [Emergomyces africanus]
MHKASNNLPWKEHISSNLPKAPFASPFATTHTAPGRGEAVLSVLPPSLTTISTLSYKYPLKLLARTPATPLHSKYPESATTPVHLYLLTYGGGLLPGDHIDVSITLQPGTRLVLTTPQGSTKIYKTERTRMADKGGRPVAQLADSNSNGVKVGSIGRNSNSEPCKSSQVLDVKLDKQTGLCYIPDPSQPFQDSQYEQIQRFTLLEDKHTDDSNSKSNDGPSLCVLDWVTQGRTARGEDWDFKSWKGRNEVWSEDRATGERKLLLRDTVVLEDETRYHKDEDGNLHPVPALDSHPIPPPHPSSPPTATSEFPSEPETINPSPLSIQERTRPHGIVGTLIVHGPLFDSLASSIMKQFSSLPRIGGQNWAASNVGPAPTTPINNASEKPPVTWTASRVRSDFVLVKFGAADFECVKAWLGELVRTEGSVEGEFGTEALGCL